MNATTDWVGRDVLSSDGERVGKVKEVHGGYFEINVSMARDYWLSCLYAEASDGAAVRLTLPANEIEVHKLDKPGMEPTGEAAAHRSDAILSDVQALEQRERMERELAIQNGVRF